jgi:hypothetical protein
MVFPDLLKEEESCAFGVDGGVVFTDLLDQQGKGVKALLFNRVQVL